MKTRTLLSAAVLTLTMSASVKAAPTDLDVLLSRLVSNAINATSEEIKNEVVEAVGNATHLFGGDETHTSVEVTYLSDSELMVSPKTNPAESTSGLTKAKSE